MKRRQSKTVVLAALTAIALSACAGADETAASTIPNAPGLDAAPPVPELDQKEVDIGKEIYGQYCASCHSSDLSGQADWKTPNADGSYPAPPHDSTGHTWHHSDQLLIDITRDGPGVAGSRMPAFGDQLTDEEIRAVIEYLKSSWGPDERAFQWQVTWQEPQRNQ